MLIRVSKAEVKRNVKIDGKYVKMCPETAARFLEM